MAVKWAWGFSTDQSRAKLNAAGWDLVHAVADPASTTYTHTYTGDAVTKRSALKSETAQVSWTPNGTAPINGWVSCSNYVGGSWRNIGLLHIDNGNTSQAITVAPGHGTGTVTVNFYLNSVFQAASTQTFTNSTWNFFAIKYEAGTTTWKGTVYANGVEIIAEQTQTGAPAWTDVSLMRVGLVGSSHYTGGSFSWFGEVVTYDSISDAGGVVVWCSTIEPTGDDSTTGTWTPSGGSDDFAVVTPWDTATDTENASPSSNDQFLCSYPSIATHLGISPTVSAIVSMAVATGGGDVQALFDDGTPVTGATVTTHATNPTYAFGTATSGLSASTTIKIGLKVP